MWVKQIIHEVQRRSNKKPWEMFGKFNCFTDTPWIFYESILTTRWFMDFGVSNCQGKVTYMFICCCLCSFSGLVHIRNKNHLQLQGCLSYRAACSSPIRIKSRKAEDGAKTLCKELSLLLLRSTCRTCSQILAIDFYRQVEGLTCVFFGGVQFLLRYG